MKFRPALFWDTNPKKIDPEKNAQYIIERVADFGRDKEARWVIDYYDKKLLKKLSPNQDVCGKNKILMDTNAQQINSDGLVSSVVWHYETLPRRTKKR